MTSDRTPPTGRPATAPALAPSAEPSSGPSDPGHLSPAAFRMLISVILTGGVTISAVLLAAGVATGLVDGWGQSLAGGSTAGTTASDFGALADNLAALRPIGIAQLGLVVLLATPVVRVGAAIVGFALERDRLYVVVSAVVLAILLASIFLLR